MMSRTETFAAQFQTNTLRVGTFLKSPAPVLVEILSLSGLDFICIDAEHAPFGRHEIDLCLGMARAVDLPALVRVASPEPAPIQQALDSGAVGILVPHVVSADHAASVARWARFGPGGRGYSGSTRSAGFSAGPKAGAVVVIAQIEDIGGVEEVDAIAGTDGIDALFFGAADLAKAYNVEAGDNSIRQAEDRIRSACKSSGKPFAFFARSHTALAAVRQTGEGGLAIVSSDQGLLLAGAKSIASERQDESGDIRAH
jgi:2-keto-3-deoxy-L-rhamnonate aldolase RhmA